MSYTPYVFPDCPNVESRQQNAPLRDGKISAVQSFVPSNVPTQNTNPNPYITDGNTVPGTQVFGTGKGYDSFPQTQDINHREISLKIDSPLLYRSNLGTPQVQSRDYRIRTVSVTSPKVSATFSNGTKGDVYGN